MTPDNQDEFLMQMRRFNLGAVGEADCPVFDGMFDYFRIYSGGSVGGAQLINDGSVDLVCNWSGGMHHAKKSEASGFCYINDIVLAILELLKVHQRVLYVDIDIHHGDGVEEAFYTTDRVMTVSFHKYGDFFPGTGAVTDVGHAGGKLYAVNVPLDNGMDDDSYKMVFEPIMQAVMDRYQPGAIVVCGGADSLSGDKLGCFNLSMQGHSNCIEFLEKFNVPMLVLGGGGYTMRNVARCWCYETGRLLGMDLPDEIPESAYEDYDYYLDTHRLRIAVSNMQNKNTRERLEELRVTVLEHLAELPSAPSATMVVAPPSLKVEGELPEEDMDVRGGGQAFEDRRMKHDDAYESDGEGGGHVDVSFERAAAAPMKYDDGDGHDDDIVGSGGGYGAAAAAAVVGEEDVTVVVETAANGGSDPVTAGGEGGGGNIGYVNGTEEAAVEELGGGGGVAQQQPFGDGGDAAVGMETDDQ